ncbi:MAG: PTS system mannose/fructose/sorbose family transporter subunit IID [Gemmatimonadales bacterium]
MTGRWRALLRLFTLQGSWNYERMQGVGMGYAAEPVLNELKSSDPARHAEAVVRSAEFFNGHPYLAGLALGALVRAEYEGVPGPQILRLRTALCSPLGALGDQFFWAGLLPTLIGVTLVAITRGAGGWAVASFLTVYNGCRLGTAIWGLRTGLASGVQVGVTIADSWLPRAVERIGPAAGFAVGLAIPLVAAWYLHGAGVPGITGTIALAGTGLLISQRFGAVASPLRFAFGAVGLALLLCGGLG